MLKFDVRTEDNLTILTLEGTIDESFQLAAELPGPGKKVNIHTRNLKRINSIGIKKWMLYLQNLVKLGAEITLCEVSPAFVEQLNLISNFNCGAKIQSVCLPYTCAKCKHGFTTAKGCKELIASQFKVPPEVCPACGAPNAEFDDFPEDYFMFLTQE